MRKYVNPRIEVTQIRLESMVLAGSPSVTPLPPVDPAPGRKPF